MSDASDMFASVGQEKRATHPHSPTRASKHDRRASPQSLRELSIVIVEITMSSTTKLLHAKEAITKSFG